MLKPKHIPLVLGPILFTLALVLNPLELSTNESGMIAILLWMLTWWITEVVHLAVTALLPLLLIPALGILPLAEVSANYGHPMIYLFFGGFVLALGIERWNLHKRIALSILRWVGHTPRRILLGFMLATAFLSAWISNTATTVMMLPMVMSVIELLREAKIVNRKLNISLLIGVAWAANVGGLATLIGTPPNLVFAGYYSENFNKEITFTDWLGIGLPVSIALLLLAFLLLIMLVPSTHREDHSIEEYLDHEWKSLGRFGTGEKRVAWIFGATALAWIFRPQIQELLPLAEFTDTSVAIASSIVLFITPSGEKSRRLLEWNDTTRLAWGILLLFGGGLALAHGMNDSGLLNHVTAAFSDQSNLSMWIWILSMTVLGIWATELMSNMALVAAMMPIVAAISAASNTPFLALAIPLTIGSSCAFMLPMATPPNAIVFGSGELEMADMVRRGIWMNLIATIVVSLLGYWLLT